MALKIIVLYFPFYSKLFWVGKAENYWILSVLFNKGQSVGVNYARVADWIVPQVNLFGEMTLILSISGNNF